MQCEEMRVMTQEALWLSRGPALLLSALCALGCPGGGPPSGQESDTTADASTTGSTVGGSSSGGSAGSGSTSSSSTTAGLDESSAGSSTGDVEVELGGMCPLATRVGGFLVSAEPEYSAFHGSVADGVVPVSVLEQVGAEGDCILLRRNNPFCKPLCMPGQTCDFDGSCIPYPQNHDVGLVEITGLLEPLMVEPVPPTFAYFDTSLMHPPFAPGALLELTAAGGDYEGFVLHGYGVPAIEPAADEISLSTGRAVQVQWGPGGSEARLRLVLKIDQHGLSPVQLVCETDDTGSLSVSAELIGQLLAFGVSGYPTADYYLQTADSVEIEPGCVEFLVYSHHQTSMSVEGHVPCDDPGDCPAGLVCDISIQTCVEP
jgi:hypothetical protein